MTAPIAGDRFKSPVVTAMARRQLFDGTSGAQTAATTDKGGQSLLTASPNRISVIGGASGNAVNAVRQQIIFGSGAAGTNTTS